LGHPSIHRNDDGSGAIVNKRSSIGNNVVYHFLENTWDNKAKNMTMDSSTKGGGKSDRIAVEYFGQVGEMGKSSSPVITQIGY
jgi:hypothetical protein